MGNTDKKKSKKFRRKIRIRLTNPNVPDSYVCEIFDSSLENEDEEILKNKNILPKGEENPAKPKNYFDLLMSKNCKKNGIEGNDARRVSHDIDDDDDDDDDDNHHENDDPGAHDETLQKEGKKITTKSVHLSANLIRTRKENCQFESSENKSFLQVQKEKKSEKLVIDLDNEMKKSLKENNEIQNDNAVTTLYSPKVDLTKKKTLSILNYFSRRDISANNNIKLKEENSVAELKTPQSSSDLCQSDKNNSKKQCKNVSKQVFLNTTNKENLKLAPLFCAKRNNSALESVKQKARLEFLHKGLPSGIKKSETKTFESISYFPVISHVQQRNDSMCWSLRQICLPLQKFNNWDCVFNDKKNFSFQIKQSPVINKTISVDRISFSKQLLRKIKCKYLKLNLGAVIDGLKDNKDRFSAQIEKIIKSNLNPSKPCNDDLEYEKLNALWTEKYKPKSNEILGNANAVRKLKKWLQSWKCFIDELKVLENSSQRSKKKKNRIDDDDDDDDDDDFLDFATKNYGLKAPGNVCIITGPNGCGKSALVYALASELEFNILELNASSKRTGKKVLSDLQEATQSHKVHGVNLFELDTVQKEVKKKRVKKQKKGWKSEAMKVTDQSYDSRISLILIEDADIVFDDHDEGFYSAIGSLVQTSKRPLIFLTSEPNFVQIENLKPDQCLRLEMERPNFYKSCAVLDVICQLEGVHFEDEILESVLRQNGFDLRKSLMELQFWVGSGKNIENVKENFDLGRLWWGLSKFLFNQDVMHLAKCMGRKRKKDRELFDSSDDEVESVAKKFKPDPGDSKNVYRGKAEAFGKTSDTSVDSYFKVLDVASILDRFRVTTSREPLPGNEYRPKDSLALCENMEEVFWGTTLTEELSDYVMSLSAKIFSGRSKEKESPSQKVNFVSPGWEEVRWRNSQEKASEELAGLVSLQKRGDKRSLYLDYLPVLRNICRVEKHRSERNPKRKNRFYHYLNNLGPQSIEENLDINCRVFSR